VLDDTPGKVSSYLTLYSVDENHNAMHLDFIMDQTTEEGTYHKALVLRVLKFSKLLSCEHQKLLDYMNNHLPDLIP